MSDQLNLTAAELAFLLIDTLDDTSAWHRLGITDEERSPTVLHAGLASLLVRGLVAADQGDFLMAPVVAGVVAAIVSPTMWVHIGLAGNGEGDTSFLFDTPDARLLLAPRAHRCFELAGLDRTEDINTPILTIVARFLDEYPPAVATVIVQTGDLAAPAPRSFIIAADTPDPVWSFASDTEHIAKDITKAEVLRRFRLCLDQLLVPRPPASSQPPLPPAPST